MGGDLVSWEGEPAVVLRELWGVPYLELHSTISSTNDRARALAEEGYPTGSVVLAEEQMSGRGREGRSWRSPRGGGIWMSWIGTGARAVDRPLTPLAAGLAAAEAIEAVCASLRVEIKWPNDLLVRGRKCAGILCEGKGDGVVVVGIGVNVRPLPPEVARELPRATSLDAESGGPVSRARVAGGIVARLADWASGPSDAGRVALARRVAERDALLGRRVRLLAGGAATTGVARGIDDHGALRLELLDGRIERVWGGSVALEDDGGVGAPTGVAPRADEGEEGSR